VLSLCTRTVLAHCHFASTTSSDCLLCTYARAQPGRAANELFFATAAKLGKVQWAQRVWSWFAQSGMINNQSLINDGLSLRDCKNNGREAYVLRSMCVPEKRRGEWQ
jgi:hypothetical protein